MCYRMELLTMTLSEFEGYICCITCNSNGGRIAVKRQGNVRVFRVYGDICSHTNHKQSVGT